MKVLLSVSVSEERFYTIPDIGMGYLASLAREAGHEVDILDCWLENYSLDDFEEHIRKTQPHVVGVKAYSTDLELLREMYRRVKRVSPAIRTVMGGPHPSTESGQRLMRGFPEVDFAFAGEGEPGFVSFLAQLEAETPEYHGVPGLVWRDETGEIHENEKQLVKDLDSLPFPAWDLLQPERYRWSCCYMNSKYPAACMSFTRGCPYLCTFCGSHLITGRRVRQRSPENIIAEIRYLQDNFGIKSIDVVDENVVFDREYLTNLCTRLIEEEVNIGWNCPYGVRLDRLDEEMVRLMERAGCFGVSLGLESGSNRILKQIRKALTVEKIIEQVEMIKRVSNITLQGFFVLGFPSETKEEIENTINLAASLPLDLAVFAPLRVTPGTEIYNTLVKEGAIQEEVDYTGFGHHYVVRSYCHVSDEEMRKLYRKAYLKFYSRPSVVFGLLTKMRATSQARIVSNGLRRLFSRPVVTMDPRKRIPQEQPAEHRSPDVT